MGPLPVLLPACVDLLLLLLLLPQVLLVALLALLGVRGGLQC